MRSLSLLLLFLTIPFAQSQTGTGRPAKYENRVETRLLDENAFFRAVGVDLAPGSTIGQINKGLDQVIVVLAGSGLSVTHDQISDSAKLAQGEALFLKRDSHAMIANSSESVTRIVAVGLKQRWDAELRSCTEPKKCTHSIQTGSAEIGHSTLLFTSGFITAYRHDLVMGGTLSSSYFSSRGKDHLLLVPLTQLRANFDGIEEELNAGQAYDSEAAQVEVTAAKVAATWIMVRVETPKHVQ